MSIENKWPIAQINQFILDPDRGTGHGIALGMFFGVCLLPVTALGIWVTLLFAIVNHLRVAYQEFYVEGWRHKAKEPDFYYDCFFRPLQTDVVLLFGLTPQPYWGIITMLALVVGFKMKNEWPLLLGFWR
jgi:hypothetical protein